MPPNALERYSLGTKNKMLKYNADGSLTKTNIYHFDGLIRAALPYAAEKAQQIEQKKAEKKARATRKGKTKFRVISSGQED